MYGWFRANIKVPQQKSAKSSDLLIPFKPMIVYLERISQ